MARVKGTVPVETELFLSVLCPVLINHYMAGKKTEQAMNFLLDAAEAYLKVNGLKQTFLTLWFPSRHWWRAYHWSLLTSISRVLEEIELNGQRQKIGPRIIST